MDPEEIQRIQESLKQGQSIRAIARSLGRNVKTIRRLLGRSKPPPSPSKLEPFKDLIRELSQEPLTTPRILREIRKRGYTGSRTILGNYLREIRGPRKRDRKVFRRFETDPAAEAQVDWSLYRVPLAGRETAVHAFSMILCYSRMLFVAFYRNEKLPTLLHAHVEAFRFFDGVARSLVYDNMATVTLGRRAGQVIFHPDFLDFARNFGFVSRVCRPRDPNRKGKIERQFAWLEADFIRASTFESMEDLNIRVREWLDTVANPRVHTTTRSVPLERFAEEKPLLIQLPEIPYATDRREVRKVQSDGTVAIEGSFYPVPNRPVGQTVTVRIYPSWVEIWDQDEMAATYRIPERPTRLPVPFEPIAPSRPPISQTILESRFLARFPQNAPFLEGLARRMKALAPVHLQKIEELAERYGVARCRLALDRAQAYRNFNALAVARVLEAAHPEVFSEPPVRLLRSNPAALGALDDLEPGSPEDYRLDSTPATEGDRHEKEA